MLILSLLNFFCERFRIAATTVLKYHHHHHHQLCEWDFFHQQLFLIIIVKDVLWSSVLKILSMDAFLVVVALISLALFASKIPVDCWILSSDTDCCFLVPMYGSSQHRRSVLTTALNRSRQKQCYSQCGRRCCRCCYLRDVNMLCR